MTECATCPRPCEPTAYACQPCAVGLATACRYAAELWPEVDVTVARQSRMGDPGPRGRLAPAAPIRPDGAGGHYGDQEPGYPGGLVVDLGASARAAAVRNTVTTWARHVATERWPDGRPERHPGPWCSHDCGHGSCGQLYGQRQAQAGYDRQMPPPAGTAELLEWLAGQTEWIRHRPEAGEMLDELADAARSVRRIVDRPAERRYLGPCDHDGCERDLYAARGATTVTCPDCGSQHDVAARVEWLDSIAADHAYTASEITAAYPHIRADRIRQWASRGRIHAASHDQRGRARYRLADVLDLATRDVRTGSAA